MSEAETVLWLKLRLGVHHCDVQHQKHLMTQQGVERIWDEIVAPCQLWTNCKYRLVFNSLADAKMGRNNSGLVTIAADKRSFKGKVWGWYEVEIWGWSICGEGFSQLYAHPEWPRYISRHFVLTPVASTFCSASVLLKVDKKPHKQSISMATMSIVHGYVTTASMLRHHTASYTPRMV